MIKSENKNCSACHGRNLIEVVDLPHFPFTGIYLKRPDNPKYRGIDQGLMLCVDCGHGQLKNIIDPSLVYDDTYSHRSSTSPIATSGNDFFIQFLKRLAGSRPFKCILEVGCNDLYLLKKVAPMGEMAFGVDPIWRGREPPRDGNIQVLGKFIEEINPAGDFGRKPNLVISAHAFEHLENPREELVKLMENADSEALFVIEVPSFDTLLELLRFDQVFHQHIQYYSLASFERMVVEAGGEYIDHTFNYNYWGGTMLIAFKKSTKPTSSFRTRFAVPSEELVKRKFKMFQDQFDQSRQVVDSLNGQVIYGYGAAQMLPTVAYHMKSDFSFMKSVLDDNPEREGFMYPYMPVAIEKPSDDFSLEDANVLITALDSLRPILKRVLSLKAKRILIPLNIF